TPMTVDALFHVRQGIRTGAIAIFVQPRNVYDSLPVSERRYFKDVVDAASFVNGEIKSRNGLFVPDRTWQTEEEVSAAIPKFFRAYLKPHREALATRKFID